MRSSSVLTFRAPALRSRAGRKCRGCARGPTTTAASDAALVSRACSPGERGVASLAAAVVAKLARREIAREFEPFVVGGAGCGRRTGSLRRATEVWRDKAAKSINSGWTIRSEHKLNRPARF